MRAGQRSFVHPHTFNKCLFSTYCMPGAGAMKLSSLQERSTKAQPQKEQKAPGLGSTLLWTFSL